MLKSWLRKPWKRWLSLPRAIELMKKREEEILPYPDVFGSKIRRRIIPEIERETFIDSWRGTFATREFTEEDKERVLRELKNMEF